jgi:hypothetical protein
MWGRTAPTTAYFEAVVRELARPARRPVVVASHPRSGTHLLIDFLRRQFPACASWKRPLERLDRLYLNLDFLLWEPPPLSADRAVAILRRTPGRPIVKTHAFADYRTTGFGVTRPFPAAVADALRRNATTLYVYRDGRCAISSYRTFLTPDMSMGEFLRQPEPGTGLSRPAARAKHVRGWLEQPGVVPVRMEDLTRRPGDVLAALERALGMPAAWREPLLPPPLRSVWHSRRARLTARVPPSTAIVVPGPRPDWRREFSAADRAFFQAESAGMLQRLGYEPDDRWVTAGDGHDDADEDTAAATATAAGPGVAKQLVAPLLATLPFLTPP